jgi:hypothetical protein
VKRIIAAGCAGALIFAGAASAATPAQKIAALQRDVKALKSTVAKQQKTINCILKVRGKCQTLKTTINDLTSLAAVGVAVEFCLVGVTADALQSTWTTFDQAMASSVFGPQQTISDGGFCNLLQITRQGIRTPPTVSAFSALVALLGTRTSAFSSVTSAFNFGTSAFSSWLR